jgi:hypothetical protein
MILFYFIMGDTYHNLINTNVIFFKIFLYNSLLQISTITKTNFVLLLLLFFFSFFGGLG